MCDIIHVVYFDQRLGAANFLLFAAFCHENRENRIFRPAFWVRSTQTLVEIYNTYIVYILPSHGEKIIDFGIALSGIILPNRTGGVGSEKMYSFFTAG